jgi:hypothetical protein
MTTKKQVKTSPQKGLQARYAVPGVYIVEELN